MAIIHTGTITSGANDSKTGYSYWDLIGSISPDEISSIKIGLMVDDTNSGHFYIELIDTSTTLDCYQITIDNVTKLLTRDPIYGRYHTDSLFGLVDGDTVDITIEDTPPLPPSDLVITTPSIIHVGESYDISASVEYNEGSNERQRWEWSEDALVWNSTGFTDRTSLLTEFVYSGTDARIVIRFTVTTDSGTISEILFTDVRYIPTDIVIISPADIISGSTEIISATVDLHDSDNPVYNWEWSDDQETWFSTDFTDNTSLTTDFTHNGQSSQVYFRITVTTDDGSAFNINQVGILFPPSDIVISNDTEMVVGIPEPMSATVDIHGIDNPVYLWEWSEDGVDWFDTNFSDGSLLNTDFTYNGTNSTVFLRTTVTTSVGTIVGNSNIGIRFPPSNIVLTVPTDMNVGTPAILSATVDLHGTTDVQYNWEWSEDGIVWVDTGFDDAHSLNVILTVDVDQSPVFVRFTVSTDIGDVDSSESIIFLFPPRDIIIVSPDLMIFESVISLTSTVDIRNGTNPVYLWEWSEDGINWFDTNFTDGTLLNTDFTYAGSNSTAFIRNTVTTSNGSGVSSESITVLFPPSDLSIQAEDQIDVGTTTTVSATVNLNDGTNPSYVWEWSLDQTVWQSTGFSNINGLSSEFTFTGSEELLWIRMTVDSDVNGTNLITPLIIIQPTPPSIVDLTIPEEIEVITPYIFTSDVTVGSSSDLTYVWEYITDTDLVWRSEYFNGTENEIEPTLTAIEDSNYTIRLTVTDGNTLSDQQSYVTNVISIPPSILSVSIPSTIQIKSEYTLVSEVEIGSSSTITYLWEHSTDNINWDSEYFIGSEDTQNPTFISLVVGAIDIRLTITTPIYGSDQIIESVTMVLVEPTISTMVVPVSIAVNNDTQFTSDVTVGSGSSLSYTWEHNVAGAGFDDAFFGDTGSLKDPVFNCTSSGAVVIRLTVETSDGTVVATRNTTVASLSPSVTSIDVPAITYRDFANALSVDADKGSGTSVTYLWEHNVNTAGWSSTLFNGTHTNASCFFTPTATGTVEIRLTLTSTIGTLIQTHSSVISEVQNILRHEFKRGQNIDINITDELAPTVTDRLVGDTLYKIGGYKPDNVEILENGFYFRGYVSDTDLEPLDDEDGTPTNPLIDPITRVYDTVIIMETDPYNGDHDDGIEVAMDVGGSGTGLTITVDSVRSGQVTAMTITNLGINYTVGDIVRSTNYEMELVINIVDSVDGSVTSAAFSSDINARGVGFRSLYEYRVLLQETADDTIPYWITRETEQVEDPDNLPSLIDCHYLSNIATDDVSYMFVHAVLEEFPVDADLTYHVGYKIVDSTVPTDYFSGLPDGLQLISVYENGSEHNTGELVSYAGYIYECLKDDITTRPTLAADWLATNEKDYGLGTITGTCTDEKAQVSYFVDIEAFSYSHNKVDDIQTVLNSSGVNRFLITVNETKNSSSGIIPSSGSKIGTLFNGETVGDYQDFQITPEFTTSTYSVSLVSGLLPEGVSIVRSTGHLIGIPTVTLHALPHTFSFSVRVETPENIFIGSYTLEVTAGLTAGTSKTYLTLPRSNLLEFQTINKFMKQEISDDALYQRGTDPSFGFVKLPRMLVSNNVVVNDDLKTGIITEFSDTNKTITLEHTGYGYSTAYTEINGEQVPMYHVVNMNLNDVVSGFNYYEERTDASEVVHYDYFTPYHGLWSHDYHLDALPFDAGTLKSKEGLFYFKNFLEWSVNDGATTGTQGSRDPYPVDDSVIPAPSLRNPITNPNYVERTYLTNNPSFDKIKTLEEFEDIVDDTAITGTRITSIDYILPNWMESQYQTKFPLVYLAADQEELASSISQQLNELYFNTSVQDNTSDINFDLSFNAVYYTDFGNLVSSNMKRINF